MASWRDKLGPAKFRNVPFHVPTLEFSGGRSSATHRYPFSEGDPYVEDLGKSEGTFRVTGYVIGDDYLSKKAALLLALQEVGSGELVHPFYGSKNVLPTSFRVSEDQNEGGMARFEIEFALTLRNAVNPVAVIDSASLVASKADAARTSAVSVFNEAFDDAARLSGRVSTALRNATLAVDAITSRVSFATQTASRLRLQTQRLQNSAVAVAASPGAIVGSLTAIVDGLKDALLETASVADPISLMLGLYGFDVGDSVPLSTESRVIEASNLDATQLLFQRLVLFAAGELASKFAFGSFDEAVAKRSQITDLIDTQSEVAPDGAFQDLTNLRSALVSAIPGADSDLPRIISFEVPATTTAINVAHQLYGPTGGRFGSFEAAVADIVDRNNIRHPGFVSGVIEVLTDG